MDPTAIVESITKLVAEFDQAMQADADNPSSLAGTYVRVRQAEEEIGSAIGALKRLSDSLQYAKLPESFQAAGVTSLTVTGYRVTAMPLVRASIAPGQKEDAFRWLRDQDFGSLIIETVNAGSLAALARSMVQDEGKELPGGLSNVHHGTTMSVTKVNERERNMATKKNGNGDKMTKPNGEFDPLTLAQEDLPEWMRGEAGRGMEQITAADVEVPRIKLLQALSPELKANEALRAGMWYHTVADASLGRSLLVIPVYIDQSFILWRPRKSGGGILARAMDGVHWTPANATFPVKLDSGRDAVWKTAATVFKSGLAEWGSTDPGDPSSPPAATRMYNVAVVILDAPQLPPAVVTMQRASIKVARKLLAKLRLATTTMPLYGLRLTLGSEEAKNAQGQDYMAPTWTMSGLVKDQKAFEACRGLYERFRSLGLKVRDEDAAQDEDLPDVDRVDVGAATQNKF